MESFSDGESFREKILSKGSLSEKDLLTFETNNPLLNIFASDLGLINPNLSLEKWSFKNKTAVTILEKGKNQTLYIKGDSVTSLKNGFVPSIQTFVINHNRRVDLVESFRSTTGQKSYSYKLKHEAFKNNNYFRTSKSIDIHEDPEGVQFCKCKIPSSFIRKYLNTIKDNEVYNQRAYIYYSGKNGSLNKAVNEYLYRFKISPKAYYRISDVSTPIETSEDPRIINNPLYIIDKENGTYYGLKDETIYSKDKIIDKIIKETWTKGAYTFAFDIMTTDSTGVLSIQTSILSLSPKDLFIMHPISAQVIPESTFYAIAIDPEKIEGRWVYPENITGTRLRIGGCWDIREQGIYKKIRIREIDSGKIIEQEEVLSGEFYTSTNLGGDLDFKIDDIKIGVNGELKRYKKKTITAKTKVSYSDKSDDLGSIILSFYDPVFRKYKGGLFEFNDITSGDITLSFLPSIKNKDSHE